MLINVLKRQYRKISLLFTKRRNQRLQNNLDYFLAQTLPQSDICFTAKCFDISCSQKISISLAIRKAIANLGDVESRFIRAESSFEELGLLKFWEHCGDAGFDSIEFIEAIEKELDITFTHRQLRSCSVQDPDLNTQLKILDFIREFYEWYAQNILIHRTQGE